METFDIWMLIAGIGLLLFGMETFEEWIKALAGKKMKYYLEKYTRWATKSLSMGTFATAILQSSSLVTLLLLGFLGAGLISLQNSIWVIIGANIWTTVSSLLVSYLWFWEFKIAMFALPIIAVWGLFILLWSKNEKLKWVGKLMVWFGLLFIGIWYMKDSVDALKDSFDLAAYKDMSLWWFWLIWVFVTIVIQSSSAMSVMTFAALASWIITFPASIAIVMWSNIWTTMTWVIASLGGVIAKRQLSFAQVLFNVISALIGIIFFWQLISITWTFINIEENPVFANAILNTIFNVFTALIFAPFLKPFTNLVKRIIPDKLDSHLDLKLDTLNPSKAEEINFDIYLSSVEFDVSTIESHVLQYIKAPFSDSYSGIEHEKKYDDIQLMSDKVFHFLWELDAPASLEQWLQTKLISLIRSSKHIKNVSHNIEALRADDRVEFKELYSMLKDAVDGYVNAPTVDAAMGYGEMLDKYYKRHLDSITALGKNAGDEDLDSSSLINMVREVEEAIGRISE